MSRKELPVPRNDNANSLVWIRSATSKQQQQMNTVSIRLSPPLLPVQAQGKEGGRMAKMRSLLPVVASLLPLLLLLAQLASVSGTFGGYSEDGTLWKCSSRNTTSSLSSSSASSEAGAAGPAGSHPGEVTCSCDGINMTSVPPVMPKMHRL
ncbi:GPA2/GPB5 Receptor, partial [Frankliniella occidentalis]